MLERANEAAVGSCYKVACPHLAAGLCGTEVSMEAQRFLVTEEGRTYSFELAASYLYVFHTQVAFLCLSLSFAEMEALKAICNPGSAYSSAAFHWIGPSGEKHPFSVESWLTDFCTPLGLRKFFDGNSSFLLDSYAYIFAVVPLSLIHIWDAVNLKYYFIAKTTNTEDTKEIQEALNEVTKEKINATVELHPLSFNEYPTKMPLMLTTGDDLDIMTSSNFLSYKMCIRDRFWDRKLLRAMAGTIVAGCTGKPSSAHFFVRQLNYRVKLLRR